MRIVRIVGCTILGLFDARGKVLPFRGYACAEAKDGRGSLIGRGRGAEAVSLPVYEDLR